MTDPDYSQYKDARFSKDGTCWFYDGHVNIDCTCDRVLIAKYGLWEFTHDYHVQFFSNTVSAACGCTDLGQKSMDVTGRFPGAFKLQVGGPCEH